MENIEKKDDFEVVNVIEHLPIFLCSYNKGKQI